MKKTLDKSHIARSFSKAALTYDLYSEFQKEIEEELFSYLPDANSTAPINILDIGCGTGNMTKRLKNVYPNASIHACDMALPMLKMARGKLPDAQLFSADLEDLPLQDGRFNIVISNLAYQWAMDLKKAFSEAHRVLKPGGNFVFSTLGQNTFKELRDCITAIKTITGKNGLPRFMNFTDAEEIAKTLKDCGFKTMEMNCGIKERRYKNLWTFLKTLKHIGAINPNQSAENSLARGAILKDVERIYKERFCRETGIIASYEVIFFGCKKIL